jgi:hypothetical protein
VVARLDAHTLCVEHSLCAMCMCRGCISVALVLSRAVRAGG